MKRVEDILKGMMDSGSQGNIPTSSNDENTTPDICSICGQTGAQNICEGLGVFRYDVPVGDPRFGKLFRCPNNPIELDENHQSRLRQLSNLDAFIGKDFDNFDAYEPSLYHAMEMAKRFAETPQGWLLLEGTYGCGKTHLAAAVGNARLKHGDVVLFITAPDLLDHLRSSFSPQAESSYDSTFDRVRNADLLILDDLGVENPSPWSQEKLFQLLNHRYTHKMPTIITTNQDIDALDARIRSRLLDVEKTARIIITAEDFRSSTENKRHKLDSSLSRYTDMRFDTFDLQNNLIPEEQRNLHNVYRAAQAFAHEPGRAWLMIGGRYGTGKTHLAAAIAHERVMRGDDVMFITVPDLLDYLRNAYNNTDQNFDTRFQKVRNVAILVLDDLGAQNPSGWANEKLFQILDYRYVTRLPTVITTSKAIDKLGERILTRVLDERVCTIYEITARSYVERRRQR